MTRSRSRALAAEAQRRTGYEYVPSSHPFARAGQQVWRTQALTGVQPRRPLNPARQVRPSSPPPPSPFLQPLPYTPDTPLTTPPRHASRLQTLIYRSGQVTPGLAGLEDAPTRQMARRHIAHTDRHRRVLDFAEFRDEDEMLDVLAHEVARYSYVDEAARLRQIEDLRGMIEQLRRPTAIAEARPGTTASPEVQQFVWVLIGLAEPRHDNPRGAALAVVHAFILWLLYHIQMHDLTYRHAYAAGLRSAAVRRAQRMNAVLLDLIRNVRAVPGFSVRTETVLATVSQLMTVLNEHVWTNADPAAAVGEHRAWYHDNLLLDAIDNRRSHNVIGFVAAVLASAQDMPPSLRDLIRVMFPDQPTMPVTSFAWGFGQRP